jgi:hypothetical protein
MELEGCRVRTDKVKLQASAQGSGQEERAMWRLCSLTCDFIIVSRFQLSSCIRSVSLSTWLLSPSCRRSARAMHVLPSAELKYLAYSVVLGHMSQRYPLALG